MPRYRKGTTDHDGDGRIGGSMKENDMAKKSARKASAHTAQTGMEPGVDTDEAKADTKARFAKADAKSEQALADYMVGVQVRGF